MNLLKETEQALEEYGYLWDDILQIQGDELTVSVDRFRRLADLDVEIEDEAPGVAQDLVILMKDGSWFEWLGHYRLRLPSSNGWAHRACPDRIGATPDGLVKRVVDPKSGSWPTLWDINVRDMDPELMEKMEAGEDE